MHRTNVVLDEKLVAEAKRVSGLATTREVVDVALRTLVRARRAQRVRALKGSGAWRGNLDASRRSRV